MIPMDSQPFQSRRAARTFFRRWGGRLALGVAGLWTAASSVSAAGEPAPEPVLVDGRFYCSVRRAVLFPFGGVVDEVACEVGQAVTNGQPLVRYRLFPDAAQLLCRRLNPSHVADLDLQQMQTENRLAQATRQGEEARRLAEQQLSSPAQVDLLQRETDALRKQAEALRARAALERRLAEEDAAMLTRLLATPLPPDVTPSQVWLTTPLDGRLISIDPPVVAGAEVLQFTPALQVGVMDPMILRAQVHERDAVRLNPGDSARITANSLPGRTFTGTLRRVFWAPAERGLEDPAYFAIEVVVANPDLSLKEGFQGRLEFDLR